MTGARTEAKARHTESGRPYLLAWLALLGLTASSYGAHYLALGSWAAPVALAIAAGKAAIVLVVFMHVLHEAPSIRFVAVLNCVWVALICGGIAADVFGR